MRRLMKKVAQWERDAFKGPTLPKDLHPHVRRRELRRRYLHDLALGDGHGNDDRPNIQFPRKAA